MRTRLLALGILLALQACASKSGPPTNTGDARTATVRRTNIITSGEFVGHNEFLSAADIVRQLRPTWSRTEIYTNNQPYGDYTALRQIPAQNVKEIQWLTKSEAQMRWGSKVAEVIHVTLK